MAAVLGGVGWGGVGFDGLDGGGWRAGAAQVYLDEPTTGMRER